MFRATPVSAVTIIFPEEPILWISFYGIFSVILLLRLGEAQLFFLSTFVSVTISLRTFTGLELSFHAYATEKVVFYYEWLNAVKPPLVKVSWSEDFYALLTEYSYVLFHTTTVIIQHTTLNMHFILCMHFLIHISCTYWPTLIMI